MIRSKPGHRPAQWKFGAALASSRHSAKKEIKHIHPGGRMLVVKLRVPAIGAVNDNKLVVLDIEQLRKTSAGHGHFFRSRVCASALDAAFFTHERSLLYCDVRNPPPEGCKKYPSIIFIMSFMQPAIPARQNWH
jgi:hypothetical protein